MRPRAQREKVDSLRSPRVLRSSLSSHPIQKGWLLSLGLSAVPLLFVFCQYLSDTLGKIFGVDIAANAWAHRLYGIPVCGIHQDTFNEGPDLAHARFDSVDCADFVPEDTVSRV